MSNKYDTRWFGDDENSGFQTHSIENGLYYPDEDFDLKKLKEDLATVFAPNSKDEAIEEEDVPVIRRVNIRAFTQLSIVGDYPGNNYEKKNIQFDGRRIFDYLLSRDMAVVEYCHGGIVLYFVIPAHQVDQALTAGGLVKLFKEKIVTKSTYDRIPLTYHSKLGIGCIPLTELGELPTSHHGVMEDTHRSTEMLLPILIAFRNLAMGKGPVLTINSPAVLSPPAVQSLDFYPLRPETPHSRYGAYINAPTKVLGERLTDALAFLGVEPVDLTAKKSESLVAYLRDMRWNDKLLPIIQELTKDDLRHALLKLLYGTQFNESYTDYVSLDDLESTNDGYIILTPGIFGQLSIDDYGRTLSIYSNEVHEDAGFAVDRLIDGIPKAAILFQSGSDNSVYLVVGPNHPDIVDQARKYSPKLSPLFEYDVVISIDFGKLQTNPNCLIDPPSNPLPVIIAFNKSSGYALGSKEYFDVGQTEASKEMGAKMIKAFIESRIALNDPKFLSYMSKAITLTSMLDQP